jgi:hypothetical protein
VVAVSSSLCPLSPPLSRSIATRSPVGQATPPPGVSCAVCIGLLRASKCAH